MKRIFVLVLTVLIMGGILTHISQIAAAGSEPFTNLTFPNSSTQSCGTWQIGVGGSQVSANRFVIYSLTDASGAVLRVGLSTRLPSSATLQGAFWQHPVRNPIRFQAFTFNKGQISNIGDIRADNPCLPSSRAPTTTPIRPTAIPKSPTVIPSTVPSPGNSYAFIGCDFANAYGNVDSIKAPFMRATVNLASNLNTELAAQVVSLTSLSYSIHLTYPVQLAGTHLVLAVGQWDGTRYVQPATLIGGDCITPTPPPPVPFEVVSATSDGVTVHGRTNQHFVGVEIDSLDNGEWIIGEQDVQVSNGEYTLTTPYFHPPFADGTHLRVRVTTGDTLAHMTWVGESYVTIIGAARTALLTGVTTNGISVSGTSDKRYVAVEIDNPDNGGWVVGGLFVQITSSHFALTVPYLHPPLPAATHLVIKVSDSDGDSTKVRLINTFTTTIPIDTTPTMVPTTIVTSVPTAVSTGIASSTPTFVPTSTATVVAANYYVRYSIGATGTCTNTSWYIPTVYVSENIPSGTVLHVVERSGNTIIRNFTGNPSRPYSGSSTDIGIANGFNLTQPYIYVTVLDYSAGGVLFSHSIFTLSCSNGIATETVANYQSPAQGTSR